MIKKERKIKVSVDKSHLFTLGEKMYRESIEFVRELVNNGYDADATNVYVLISDDKIIVEDDGGGMNEKGLGQFFTIGSEEKVAHNVSPRYGRKRIGQFGIGKFSALSLANQFIVETVKGKYKYRVVFDRLAWQSETNWELPISKEPASVLDKEGTKIILNKLTKKISMVEAEKYLKQSVPLRAKKFNVFLNNKKISAVTVPGKTIPLNIKTMYGAIEGEIIVALSPLKADESGLECRVKQVLIKRSFFELEKKYHQGINRITGSVNADFLPLISARSDFIIDSPEYKLFFSLMQTQLEKILSELRKKSEIKNLNKVSKELQEVMQQIKDALLLNPDFAPQGRAITRLKKEAKTKIAVASASLATPSETESKKRDETKKPENPEPKPKENPIEVKPLVVKKIRIKKLGISCSIASLGENEAEAVSRGNMIYINQDHPLYQKLYKKQELLGLHLLRVITREIILMKKLRLTAEAAFDWQSKLLKDAICE